MSSCAKACYIIDEALSLADADLLSIETKQRNANIYGCTTEHEKIIIIGGGPAA
jgi:hypothetical protein